MLIPDPAKFRLPNSSQRIAIMGRNGTGKTHFATWILSQLNYTTYPWVIVDYKYDELLNSIENTREIGLQDKIPRKPGIYLVHPRPDEVDDTEKFLWKIWEKERTGLYIDEGYVVPAKGAFQALLTQGRSKHIPMMVLTQRPSWVSRFVFSEANFYSIFHLNDRRDQQTIQQFAPVDMAKPLPARHSYYHDVDRYLTFKLSPAPDRDSILDRFEQRLGRRRKVM